MTTVDRSEVRLAELVATISLGTDLGLGQPMEHVIRQTIIALRMGEPRGLSDEDRTVLSYAGLLAWVGCHTDAYEQAKWFGDDIEFKHAMFTVESHWRTTDLLAERLGLGADVRPSSRSSPAASAPAAPRQPSRWSRNAAAVPSTRPWPTSSAAMPTTCPTDWTRPATHLRQDRGEQPGHREPVRDAARPRRARLKDGALTR